MGRTYVGAQIDDGLKKELSDYLGENGISLNFFITEAIKERFAKAKTEKHSLQHAFDNISYEKGVSREAKI